jgi:hypothetical protein
MAATRPGREGARARGREGAKVGRRELSASVEVARRTSGAPTMYPGASRVRSSARPCSAVSVVAEGCAFIGGGGSVCPARQASSQCVPRPGTEAAAAPEGCAHASVSEGCTVDDRIDELGSESSLETCSSKTEPPGSRSLLCNVVIPPPRVRLAGARDRGTLVSRSHFSRGPTPDRRHTAGHGPAQKPNAHDVEAWPRGTRGVSKKWTDPLELSRTTRTRGP